MKKPIQKKITKKPETMLSVLKDIRDMVKELEVQSNEPTITGADILRAADPDKFRPATISMSNLIPLPEIFDESIWNKEMDTEVRDKYLHDSAIKGVISRLKSMQTTPMYQRPGFWDFGYKRKIGDVYFKKDIENLIESLKKSIQ